VWSETFDLARFFESRDRFKESVEAFDLASQKPVGADTRTRAMRWQVTQMCDFLDDGGQAYKIAEAWNEGPNVKTEAAHHTAHVALIYAAIARGDGKTAAQEAKDTGNAPGVATLARTDRQPIDQGVLARNIESAIAAKEYDQAANLIMDWENDYPAAMLDGFTRLLRVKLYAAEGHAPIAARVALQHAKAVPTSFYAAELLYRAAENFKAAGRPEDATTTLDLLKQKYPESPYARNAIPSQTRP
jgi:TolA-binding protein